MDSIIIALPKEEDAKRIGAILKKNGLEPTVICTTASKVISHVHQLDSGIVICGPRFLDMHYTQLVEYLPKHFEMLLLASSSTIENCLINGITTLQLPIKAVELINTVQDMLCQLRKRTKKPKSLPQKRNEQEQNYINNAKRALMEINNMTEQEAFRYIQKMSMDTGVNKVETAQKVLRMLCGY
ncbi:MAG: ANTAR domain-containing protein [Lachnospiraceae bacterium]|nr:ANTAR domain-containing protein [Lachnospiraceae bacterium]